MFFIVGKKSTIPRNVTIVERSSMARFRVLNIEAMSTRM